MAPKRPVHLVQSEVWLGRTEFQYLIRQRGPETVEAPRYPATGTKAVEELELMSGVTFGVMIVSRAMS